MYLIVGLGNPGKEYTYTKHNTGFIILDNIASKLNISISRKKFRGLYSDLQIGNEKVIFLKPQTYMNLSGESIIQFVEYFKIPKENVVVIYDDIDLDIGSMRIRKSGSAGTHNGMKSIVQHLKTENFPRIRIGINKKDRYDIMDYVLSNYIKEEIENLKQISENVYNTVLDIINGDIEHSMNMYN